MVGVSVGQADPPVVFFIPVPLQFFHQFVSNIDDQPMLIDAVKEMEGKIEYLYVDIDKHQKIAELLRVSNSRLVLIFYLDRSQVFQLSIW